MKIKMPFTIFFLFAFAQVGWKSLSASPTCVQKLNKDS